jgi:hypothetical protein
VNSQPKEGSWCGISGVFGSLQSDGRFRRPYLIQQACNQHRYSISALVNVNHNCTSLEDRLAKSQIISFKAFAEEEVGGPNFI